METVRKRVMVLDRNDERSLRIVESLTDQQCFAYRVFEWDRTHESLYDEPPDLIVMTADGENWAELLRALKSDVVFGHIGVLAVCGRAVCKARRAGGLPVDDFLFLPLDEDELKLRVGLALEKAERRLDANPLSRLPGHFTVMQVAQQRIDAGRPFAYAHIDIDNFRAFNDRYGFERGDQVIRMAARVLANTVRAFGDARAFVGHLGGDDFVLMANPLWLKAVSRQLIAQFDVLAPTFYDDAERLAGWIQAPDRQGRAVRHPLMTLSIAAVCSTSHSFTHYGQYAAAADEVKKKVKRLAGSNFLLDRRCSKAADSAPEEISLPH